MCGRYALNPAATHFSHLKLNPMTGGLSFSDVLLQREPQFNIAPTQKPPVMAAGEDGLELRALGWGLVPIWAKSVAIGAKAINARVESVQTNGCSARRSRSAGA